MQAPPSWIGFSQYLGIPNSLGHAVWAGLRRARWSEASAVRQAFLLHMRGRFDPTGLTAHAASPAKLLRALELCVRERVLAARDARRCEEYVLDWMTHDRARHAAWESTYQPGWFTGPPPDMTRWLTKAEHEQRLKERTNYGTRGKCPLDH